ncbi:MAG: isoleucine--tRNA ligase [Patescibacteria group bacterium]|jgi:isoleucyl-tRNA synthetase
MHSKKTVAEKPKQKPKSPFPKMEEEILDFWENEKIFSKTLAKTKNGERFRFFEGPPTANGQPGIHHVLARIYKDVIVRFKTMQGFYVERKAGWDTHGLPVELQVEKALKISGKQQIENIVSGDKRASIIKFNDECKKTVMQYRQDWEEITKRIGFWLDLDNPYITYNPDYIESVWWVLKQISEKKDPSGQALLYKGHKVVQHCPRCETALSSHEVAQGYKTVTENSVYLKFKVQPDSVDVKPNLKKIIKSDSVYILSWTTTPWTLPGNVALAIGKDINYVVVKKGDEQYILAKDRLDILEDYKILGEVPGKELIGLSYESLFSGAVDKGDSKTAWTVLPADFVTTADGTGVVHTAVMYGEDDYQLGKKNGLPTQHTVDQTGKFLPSVKKWAGKFVKDKNVETGIIQDLQDRKLLLKVELYTHEYPFCWRCETPLLYYAKDSWFIRMSSLRAELLKNNQDINWVPAYLKNGRFGEWLKEVKDWAISRERYWGTPLPIWVCEKCENMKVIGSFKELLGEKEHLNLLRENNQLEFDPHRPFVDEIKLKCDKCSGEMSRVPEVMDVWFDSGAMPFAQWHYPFENKERIEQGLNFPADYISEAIDQTRGWFYTLLAISTSLGKGAPYRNVISLGHILDNKGQKMSKSKGNIVEPNQVINEFGADALRIHLFIMSQAGDPKLFDKKGVDEVVKKTILIFWNIFTFYQTYVAEAKPKDFSGEPEGLMDKWVLARLSKAVSTITQKLENFDPTSATRELQEFIIELSTWYLRRSRDRLRPGENFNQESAGVIKHVIKQTAVLMAPFAPFLAEKIYQEVKAAADPESVHLETWPKASKPETPILKDMEIARQAVELGHAIRKENNLKVRQPLSLVEVNKKVSEEMLKILSEELNVVQAKVVKNISNGNFWKAKTGGDLTVNLNSEISEELRHQGLVREMARQINDLRKSAGLTIKDLVDVEWQTEDENLKHIFTEHAPELRQLTRSRGIKIGKVENVEFKKDLLLGESRLVIGMKK